MLAGRALYTLLLNGVVIGAVCSTPAHAADSAALGVVRLAPQQERAAPPPPKRPYAINGESFYYEGTKIIIEGLVLPRPDSELAKQRLQRRLDSGEITYAPIGEPNGGVVRARVSIDGQALNN
ncbi:hypothetical protein [Nitrogeniibacter aestuarii]|uniref:hypothetical protein n=1 Tax=Nitrogeniibacter aestuarii TaxID=2815343 RepID=UPI001E3121D0|nr:hypothetical protein [Nitrogeniibacter aestuarii]